MAKNDYNDPFGIIGDPFQVQRKPKGGIKKPRSKPALAPEPRALYDIQTDLLKALSSLDKEGYDGGAGRPLKNAYKILNRYLREYVQGTKEKDLRGGV